ncbi:MAG: GTPase [Phycisphaerales bacterium]|nr:GTPase [Phycisphaerales bacterium]MCB9857531.1 GTPase [Phycisphaerales bacterium]MCB9864484.1 GTPase [Phycisphaerales bacterium]
MASASTSKRIVIIGAAGRDFHNFNCLYRDDPQVRVVAFTAAQIPNIDGRTYPSALAGKHYPEGVPIVPEEDLEKTIRDKNADVALFSYSDVSYAHVMGIAARVNAAGAAFELAAPVHTMLPSKKPVIAICAVRTGCGKSQTTRLVAQTLKAMGKRVAVIRHPMPYGDLAKQACQRFGELADMDRHECTIEEREEYELHIEAGNLLFAGVDYHQILRAAEAEADVMLWDGGNNDTAFFEPDLLITVADPHRAGHELAYYPGELNFRMADVILINKVKTAKPEAVELVAANAARVNPGAEVIRGESRVTLDNPDLVRGKRVLVVEDGPTLTHGGMTFGAGHVAAKQAGAGSIVDPRPFAVGSIKTTFAKYNHLTDILPAMGYGQTQMSELEKSINAADCDAVVIGTPIDLSKLLKINKPSVRVRYELAGEGAERLAAIVKGHPSLKD